MGIHRMEKGIAGQAVRSATARSRIVGAGAAIAANDVVAGIAGVRWIVDSKLRVVEDVESLGTELKISLAEDFEVLQQ